VESELIDPILAELLTSIYAADFETGLHSQRTAITALALSKQIGWNEVEQRGFFIGALLHDLGKTPLTTRAFAEARASNRTGVANRAPAPRIWVHHPP
jgi:HD-GYP domain-containing protein (c-di-GMP phosphodiesterase class II)